MSWPQRGPGFDESIEILERETLASKTGLHAAPVRLLWQQWLLRRRRRRRLFRRRLGHNIGEILEREISVGQVGAQAAPLPRRRLSRRFRCCCWRRRLRRRHTSDRRCLGATPTATAAATAVTRRVPPVPAGAFGERHAGRKGGARCHVGDGEVPPTEDRAGCMRQY